MFKNAGIATILGLSLMAGCAADLGSQQHDLATVDIDQTEERCFRDFGDYEGDVVPPPINISLGDDELSATELLQWAKLDDSDAGRLLGEFVATHINIDTGADITIADIDVLIGIEDRIVAINEGGESDPDELADLIAAVEEINQRHRMEVPCIDHSNEGIVAVDSPLKPHVKDSPRQGPRVVGASAEPSEEPPAPPSHHGRYHR